LALLAPREKKGRSTKRKGEGDAPFFTKFFDVEKCMGLTFLLRGGGMKQSYGEERAKKKRVSVVAVLIRKKRSPSNNIPPLQTKKKKDVKRGGPKKGRSELRTFCEATSWEKQVPTFKSAGRRN